jgi:hypothetical protein
MTSSDSSSNPLPPLRAIGEREFRAAIGAWETNTLSPRTGKDYHEDANYRARGHSGNPDHAVDPLKLGAGSDADTTADMAIPAVIIAQQKDSGDARISGLTFDLHNHLQSEKVPHGMYHTTSYPDSNTIKPGPWGLTFLVQGDDGAERMMVAAPDMVRLDRNAPLVESFDEHKQRLDALGINAANGFVLDEKYPNLDQSSLASSGALSPNYNPKQTTHYGYKKPAHMVGRSRSQEFNSSTGAGDIELNPKKGYSKWG